jgi:hypothetical protein
MQDSLTDIEAGNLVWILEDPECVEIDESLGVGLVLEKSDCGKYLVVKCQDFTVYAILDGVKRIA